MKKILFILLILIFKSSFLFSQENFIEKIRRRPQFDKSFSYGIIPVPYSIPGLGEGLGVGISINNVYESELDIKSLGIFGDVEGFALGITDFYIIPERFFLNFGASYINKASFLINSSRGMKGNEDPDDFNSAELSKSSGAGVDATLTFFQRMLDFNLSLYSTNANIKSIRDKDGNILINTEGSDNDREHILGGGFLFDLTDDKNDPRVGFRFSISANMPLDVDSNDVKSYVVDINSTAYVPVLSQSTVVFNYFHSDSHVTRKGDTDRDNIIDNYYLNVTHVVQFKNLI